MLESRIRCADAIWNNNWMLSNVDAQDASKVKENAKVTLFLANKKCNVDSTRGRTD